MNTPSVFILFRCPRPLLCSGDMSDTSFGTLLDWYSTGFAEVFWLFKWLDIGWTFGVVLTLKMVREWRLFSEMEFRWNWVLPFETNRQINNQPRRV